ncbi:hypothetical protein BKA67DRAFT_696517 [Truncatella angustata]|uniref:Uncharacterized protein n=1 Tax=Truncatella angustata TaxID=152316 RepID=A0A9P8U8R7_9PEZI|nr:uncharacterized protein BKA67DRAFT_696517 [Truncatella angustata]KAH6645469.1 hypothetical protein BKA67DRAFT_696517 [Truncatella angustata]KAH8200916.1 hypothetical protein TruAng_004925 [Truncatella angustata]
MQFSTAIYSTVALLMASKAMGAAIEVRDSEVAQRAAMVATSPYYACNCPNNCSHKSGSSCKFYSGPSDNSDSVSGKCVSISYQLTCIAT